MKYKRCPKCNRVMNQTVQFGNEDRPYAIDVWSCDDCNYTEPFFMVSYIDGDWYCIKCKQKEKKENYEKNK